MDRLETTIEAHTLPVAQVREACTIPGTRVRTAWLCRDKPSMKQALRGAGVPTAASTAAAHVDEVYAFAAAIGFPLILKPRSGAGALDTVRVDDNGQLEQALGRFGGQGVESIAVEEFVEGHEGFYDTVAVARHGRAGLRLALLPERAGGDAQSLDLARSSSPPTGSIRWATTSSCARWAPG